MNKNRSIQDELLLEELKRNGGNVSKAARVLGINYYGLIQRLMPSSKPVFIPPSGPEPEDIRVLGREGFRHFVIAVKKAGLSWPVKYDDVLKDARNKFDNGTHEMFQTTENGWVVQYLIPRKRAVKRPPFFRNMESV